MSNFNDYQVSNNFQIRGFWGTDLENIKQDKDLVAGLLSYKDGRSSLELFGNFSGDDFSKGDNNPGDLIIYGISFDGLIIKSSSFFSQRVTRNAPGYMSQNFELQSFSILRNISSLETLLNKLSATEKILKLNVSHLDDWLRHGNQLMEQHTDSVQQTDTLTFKHYLEDQLGHYDFQNKDLKISIMSASVSGPKDGFSFSVDFENRIKFIMVNSQEEFSTEYSIMLASSMAQLLTLLTNRRSHPTSIVESYSMKPSFSSMRSFIYEREDYFKTQAKSDFNIPFSFRDLGLTTIKQILSIWFGETDKLHALINNYFLQYDYPTPISIGLVNLVSGIESYYSEEKYGPQNAQIQNVQSGQHKHDNSDLDATTKIYKLIDSLPNALSDIVFSDDAEKVAFLHLINDNRVYFVHGTQRLQTKPESELVLPYRKLNFLIYAFILQQLKIPEQLVVTKMSVLYQDYI